MATFVDELEVNETKYRLTPDEHAAMLAALRDHMVPDERGQHAVTSVYYDTPDHLMARSPWGSARYNEKLRLRMYGTPADDDRVLIELKKKYGEIAYKRRVALSYQAAQAYLGGLSYERACELYPLPDPAAAADSLAPRSLQIAHEIDLLFLRYDLLQAAMAIVCDRTVYAPIPPKRPRFRRPSAKTGKVAAPEEATDLRITFDEGIGYCDLLSEDEGEGFYQPLLTEGDVIMEIRANGRLPEWLTEQLSGKRAYPPSFSKCDEAYRASARRDLIRYSARARLERERIQ